MRPVPVVVMQPGRQVSRPLLGAFIAAGVGPLAQARLDKALGLAVGTWRIGLRADVPQSQAAAQAPERSGPIAGAVVSHDSPEADAQSAVVAQGLKQSPASAVAALIRVQAREGQPGCIVDGYVDKLPARATGVLLTVAGDPMPGLPETTEFLDVQVQEVAGGGVLVAHHHRGWFQLSQPVKAGLLETAGDCADGQAQHLGDVPVGLAGPAQLDQLLDHGTSRGMRA